MRFIKVPFCMVFLVLLMPNGVCQNLVLNPSFEQYDTCPNSAFQLNRAKYWFSANWGGGGSSEYYNACDNPGPCGVPYNYLGGFQYARTGNAYCGTGFYKNDSEYREYVEGTLNAYLNIGTTYCVSFYVSLSDYSTYGIDALGIYFTNDSLITHIGGVWHIIPQVLNDSLHIITDTTNWTKISGSFTAFGGERFFTIGNFKYDNQTNTITVLPQTNGYSYYLIDDVAVYECDAPVHSANEAANKTICKGESVQIGMPHYDEYFFEWHTMDGTLKDTTSYLTVSPSATTSYVLIVKDFKFDITTDTVTVVVDDAICTQVYIPNIFSPNKDGQNDIFRVRGEQIESLHLQVYNRWGNMVFESNDVGYGWDGMFQGKECEEGVYAWWVEIVFKNGEHEMRKGNVSLVR